jgi:hypothetical protein
MTLTNNENDDGHCASRCPNLNREGSKWCQFQHCGGAHKAMDVPVHLGCNCVMGGLSIMQLIQFNLFV